MKLVPSVDTSDANDLRDKILQFIRENPHASVKEETCFCSVQAPPWRKPFHQIGGRAMTVLARHGIDRRVLKPEFGPPVRIFKLEAGKPVKPELVKFDKAKSSWEIIDEDLLKAMCPSHTAEEILEALNE